MSVALSVSVTITPEAAARVAELRLQNVFDLMLEQVGRLIPGLRDIRVYLDPDCDGKGEYPGVVIVGHVDGRTALKDAGWQRWCHWKNEVFTPDVHQHFCLLTIPVEVHHAG